MSDSIKTTPAASYAARQRHQLQTKARLQQHEVRLLTSMQPAAVAVSQHLDRAAVLRWSPRAGDHQLALTRVAKHAWHLNFKAMWLQAALGLRCSKMKTRHMEFRAALQHVRAQRQVRTTAAHWCCNVQAVVRSHQWLCAQRHLSHL